MSLIPVITGMGAVSPFGVSVARLWSGVQEGHSALSPISRFQPEAGGVSLGGEVPGMAGIDEPTRFEVMWTLASNEALRSADLVPGRIELLIVARTITVADRDGSSTRGILSNVPRVGLHSACSTGLDAIAFAARCIRAGRNRCVLVGGVDTPVNPALVASFSSLGVLTRGTDPSTAVAPFRTERSGMVLAEGAGFVVIEELSHAIERGATPLAVISGFGCSMDAEGIVNPAPDGCGAERAIRRALHSSRLEPSAVSAVITHGTGTFRNDLSEGRALRRVFAGRAVPPVIGAPKAHIGHAIVASGLLSAIISVPLAAGTLQFGPRFGTEDPLCAPPSSVRTTKPGPVVCNAFAFGGLNACVVVSPVT